MRYLFDLADQYIRECDWKDLALLKLCLCAMGILLGAAAPGLWGSGGIYGHLYPLDGQIPGSLFPRGMGGQTVERRGTA